MYLIITGIGAFVALAMPSLVILGFFLLIIPGLILSLMPTAFMYGVIFTAGWFAARTAFGDGIVAILVGVAVLAFVVTATTKPTRAVDFAAYNASILPDVTPAKLIGLKGNVRFNFSSVKLNKLKDATYPYVKGTGGYVCDSYCIAALFTPGVSSVTVDQTGFDDNGKPSIEARTYRLLSKPGCTSNIELDFGSITAPLRGDPGGGIASYEDGKVLVAQWAMKLANDYCLVMEPALAEHDFTITEQNKRGQSNRKKWDFGPGSVETQTIEIHQGANLVYRTHQSSLNTLSKLLLIEPTGGMENFRFGWSRATINSKKGYDSVTLQKSLGESTNLAGKPVSGSGKKENAAAMLPALRTQLSTALSDPSLTAKSPSFQVMESYFKAVGDNAEPVDVELLSKLFADPRITRYEGAWHLNLPVDQMIPVYNAYTQRVIAGGYPLILQKSLMDNAVSKMGPAVYKLIGPAQKPLLDDPIKRLAVPELVKALGYGPAINGKNLLLMLKQHAEAKADIDRRRNNNELKGYGEQAERDAHTTLIGAAKAGLCIMAPRDPTLLQELEDFLSSGVLPKYQVQGNEMASWDVILVRMGKPISSVNKPENLSGTADNHRRRVQSRVDRWTPEDCR